jgi:hypothetical protein
VEFEELEELWPSRRSQSARFEGVASLHFDGGVTVDWGAGTAGSPVSEPVDCANTGRVSNAPAKAIVDAPIRPIRFLMRMIVS